MLTKIKKYILLNAIFLHYCTYGLPTFPYTSRKFNWKILHLKKYTQRKTPFSTRCAKNCFITLGTEVKKCVTGKEEEKKGMKYFFFT